MSLLSKKMKEKFIPVPDREYILTDQCFWKTDIAKDYNPFDPSRAPHSVQLVDVKTGTIVNLPSGSIIKIVTAAKP